MVGTDQAPSVPRGISAKLAARGRHRVHAVHSFAKTMHLRTAERSAFRRLGAGIIDAWKGRMSKKPEETADTTEKKLHDKEHRGHLATEASVAAGGAALGALIGSVAGPPGMIAGAVVGGVVGAAAGVGFDREVQHEDAIDRSIEATDEESEKQIDSRRLARKSGTPPPPADEGEGEK
jgi:phage tail tape-measure protein